MGGGEAGRDRLLRWREGRELRAGARGRRRGRGRGRRRGRGLERRPRIHGPPEVKRRGAIGRGHGRERARRGRRVGRSRVRAARGRRGRKGYGAGVRALTALLAARARPRKVPQHRGLLLQPRARLRLQPLATLHRACSH
jgi:hypothetical protein